MLKNQNAITILSLIIAIIIIVILIVLSVKIINLNDSKSKALVSNELEISSEQHESKSYIESTDYEIAKILFENYFEDKFNKSLITEASYNSQRKEFSCTYVIKTFENFYEKDYVEIRTNDFITYWYTSVEYIYDKDKDMNMPHSWNTTYNEISNESKNKIINLARNKGYYTAKNLTNDEYEIILKIILENDEKNLQKIIEKNDYILNNNYLSEDRVYYLFTQKNNKENYIEISSWISGFMGWKVYGSSNNSIYNDSYYSGISQTYIIDYDIKIEEQLNELEKIYNNLNK